MTSSSAGGPAPARYRCGPCGEPAVATTLFGDYCASCLRRDPGIYRGGDGGVLAAVGPDGRWWRVWQTWCPGDPVPTRWEMHFRHMAGDEQRFAEVCAYRDRPDSLLRPALSTARHVLEVIDRGGVPAVLVAGVYARIDPDEAAEVCRYATHLCATQLSADPSSIPAELAATFEVLPSYGDVAWDVANRYAPRWEALPGDEVIGARD